MEYLRLALKSDPAQTPLVKVEGKEATNIERSLQFHNG